MYWVQNPELVKAYGFASRTVLSAESAVLRFLDIYDRIIENYW